MTVVPHGSEIAILKELAHATCCSADHCAAAARAAGEGYRRMVIEQLCGDRRLLLVDLIRCLLLRGVPEDEVHRVITEGPATPLNAVMDVDVMWIETMSALEEVEAALEGIRRAAPDVPVVVTMSFDTHGHTMMGVSPEHAATALTARGAAAVGGNCGLGPVELLQVITKMRATAPDAVLVAKPNAGLPELEDGRAVYRGSPAEMAEYARLMVAGGARIVGGCCGSAPEHLRAMAEALGVKP